MTIQLFKGFGYFFYMAIFIASAIGGYFLLRKQTNNVKKRVILSILFFALILHFMKLLFPPYADDPNAVRKITPENICALSTLIFPFIFLSKNKVLKDYMFYIGILSGTLAVLIPIESLEKDAYIFAFDTIRFYLCHIIITVAPFLMVATGLHRLDYHRVYKVPLIFMVVLAIIMINEIILMEIGLVPLRNTDLLDPEGYRNFSMIFGLRDTFGQMGQLLTALTPNFLMEIPYGPYAGEAKYWPLVWLILPSFILIGGLSFLMSLFWEWNHFKMDLGKLKNYCIRTFSKKIVNKGG
ncbi:MAG: hypothetical protein WC182_04060 [Bacilli bacterium]